MAIEAQGESAIYHLEFITQGRYLSTGPTYNTNTFRNPVKAKTVVTCLYFIRQPFLRAGIEDKIVKHVISGRCESLFKVPAGRGW